MRRTGITQQAKTIQYSAAGCLGQRVYVHISINQGMNLPIKLNPSHSDHAGLRHRLGPYLYGSTAQLSHNHRRYHKTWCIFGVSVPLLRNQPIHRRIPLRVGFSALSCPLSASTSTVCVHSLHSESTGRPRIPTCCQARKIELPATKVGKPKRG